MNYEKKLRPDFSLSELRSLPPLPIDSVCNKTVDALKNSPVLLMEAPPGTGKSTRVPLWALACLTGRILLLEPRRVAARMLAEHLAALLHEHLGRTVGLAMREETRVSHESRLLVVTQGVFTRMICSDQSLEGFSCVLFDEFHERSLNSDTGLALALDCQQVLRPDLRIGVLSATLDIAALKKVVPLAPVIRAQGQAYPVRIAYAPDCSPGIFCMAERLRRLPQHTAEAIIACISKEKGSVLVFLPGAKEIRQTSKVLNGRLPPNCLVFPLTASLTAEAQKAALEPAPEGKRKIVLATDIAETSLTIQGIRIIVDSGLHRRPRYDPASSFNRLETRNIPLSSAAQRAGRAGRLCPGLCIRLWSKESECGLAEHAHPEILEADLAALCLDLAHWGAKADQLPFITSPPAAALEAGKMLLRELGAIDSAGIITPEGRIMAGLGLPPRMAAVLLNSSKHQLADQAAVLCTLLEHLESSSKTYGSPDLTLLLDHVSTAFFEENEDSGHSASNRATLRARLLLQELHKASCSAGAPSRTQKIQLTHVHMDSALAGELLLPGYADSLALRSEKIVRTASGVMRIWQCRNGRRLLLPNADSMNRYRFLLALDCAEFPTASDRGVGQGYLTLRLGIGLAEDIVLSALKNAIKTRDIVTADNAGHVTANKQTCLDALILSQAPLPNPDPAEINAALCTLVRQKGIKMLPLGERGTLWLDRCRLLAKIKGAPWPDMREDTLLADWQNWLPALFQGITQLKELDCDRVLRVLQGLLPWQCARELESLAPVSWQAPSGKVHKIMYTPQGPLIELKLQECFGLATSPSLPCGLPITLHLNSPAGAPLAVTRDLTYFWREVYPSVRAEMRGRYPKHPWPEDPIKAMPTSLTNRRLAALQVSAPTGQKPAEKKSKRQG